MSHRCLRLKTISNDRRIADHVFLVVGTVWLLVQVDHCVHRDEGRTTPLKGRVVDGPKSLGVVLFCFLLGVIMVMAWSAGNGIPR